MKIIWSPLAIERLEEIAEYIQEDDPIAAKKMGDLRIRQHLKT